MKTQTIVSEITHEELVNLFSTALYGSCNFSARYNRPAYHALIDESPDGEKWEEEDCLEDRLARMLIAGHAITINDLRAEDEDEFYENLPHEWKNETMRYTVTLDDIKRGVAAAMDGTFLYNDSHEPAFLRKCVADWVDEEGGEFDICEAEALLQVIVFGEVIYG